MSSFLGTISGRRRTKKVVNTIIARSDGVTISCSDESSFLYYNQTMGGPPAYGVMGLLLGFENIKQPLIDKTLINYTGSYTFLLIFIIVSSLVLYVVGKFKLKWLRPVLFGLISGIYGGLDPIFKELGLAFDQGDGLFPVHLIGWFFYVVSFIMGFGAFFLTQLGFSKNVEASVLVPVYNSAFVTFPIIFQMISYPNYVPSIITFLGIIICITGIFLMQIFKRFFTQINEDIPKK